jgi:dihydrofolate reductase
MVRHILDQGSRRRRPGAERKRDLIRIVVAYGEGNRVIGREGKLPWEGAVPGELGHFKGVTMGLTLIMGRLTWESLRRDSPLPGRRAIVLSRRNLDLPAGVEIAGSLGEALSLAGSSPVSIVGGQEVYAEALARPGLVTEVVASEIKGDWSGDRFFPQPGPGWEETATHDRGPFTVVHFTASGSARTGGPKV